uniref:Uncharacterized protein n=1 Tax=Pyricularia oryzae (strain P131) TaxID=1143193 RepID=L7JM29_PYRO1
MKCALMETTTLIPSDSRQPRNYALVASPMETPNPSVFLNLQLHALRTLTSME